METTRRILRIESIEELARRWEKCVKGGDTAVRKVEEELDRSQRMKGQVERLRHDYGPFVEEYVRLLHGEGILTETLRE